MPYTTKRFAACGWLVAALFASAGCEPKRLPPETVTDLMGDRVTLDGVLMKCNQDPDRARNATACLNARIAIERLAKDVDPSEEAKRNADFERRREQLRLAQEKARAEQEAKAKIDAYDLPLVPVDSTAAAAAGVPGAALAKP
jgi:hypothetical protein